MSGSVMFVDLILIAVISLGFILCGFIHIVYLLHKSYKDSLAECLNEFETKLKEQITLYNLNHPDEKIVSASFNYPHNAKSKEVDLD